MAWIAPKPDRYGQGVAVQAGRAERSAAVPANVQAFLTRVYTFMALGLAITGVVALAVAASPAAMAFVFGGRWTLMVLIVA